MVIIIIIIIHLAPYYRLPRLAHKAPVTQAKPRTEWRGDALRFSRAFSSHAHAKTIPPDTQSVKEAFGERIQS